MAENEVGQKNLSKHFGTVREVQRQSDDTNTARTLTVFESGCLFLLDEDEAYTLTLPAITSADIGVSFTILETVASNELRSVVTAYNNDYYIGGVANLFDAAKTEGSTGGIAFLTAGSTDTTIKFDDDLANGGGGVGSWVQLTAVLTGNTAAGGGSKFVWAVTGAKIAQAETDTGAAFFA